MFYGNYDIFVINLKQKVYITHDNLYLCTETNKVFFFGSHHRSYFPLMMVTFLNWCVR